MAQTYSVKIVSEKEWEKLRGSDPRYANIEDSLGFADPTERKGYVRQTHWPELNKFLLDHEFEHLLNPENGSDRDEHGIYHKKFFKDIIAPYALPVLGTLLGGPLGGALGGVGGSLIGAGLGGAAGAVGGRAIQQGGVGKGYGQSALLGGLGGLGSKLIPAALSKFNPGVGAGAGTTFQTSAPGLGGDVAPRLNLQGAGVPLRPGVGGAPVAGSTALRGFSAAPSTGSQLFPLGGGTQTPPAKTGVSQILGNLMGGGGQQTTPQTTQTQPSIWDKFGISSKLLGPAALGLGISGIGQMAGPKTPSVPEFGQLAGVQRFGQESQSRLGSLAGRFQNLPNTQLPDTLLSPIRRQYELQRHQFTSQFKAFRPGADLATDTEYARGINDLNQREAEAVSGAQLNFQGEQRQNLLGELGVTEDQLGSLGMLAQADIDTIRLRTGLSAEEASQFKQIFGELGLAVAGAGF